MEGSAQKIVPNWHIDSEVRQRLWYEFWHDMVKTKGGEKAAARLHELEISSRENGLHTIENFHRDLSEDPALRSEVHARFMTDFEGVDFNDPIGNGWCKLWTKPFPFTACCVYDEMSAKPQFYHSTQELRDLLAHNTSDHIVAKRALREDLRSLSEGGDRLYLPRTEFRTFHVPDGTHTVTDSDGNSKTVQDYRWV